MEYDSVGNKTKIEAFIIIFDKDSVQKLIPIDNRQTGKTTYKYDSFHTVYETTNYKGFFIANNDTLVSTYWKPRNLSTFIPLTDTALTENPIYTTPLIDSTKTDTIITHANAISNQYINFSITPNPLTLEATVILPANYTKGNFTLWNLKGDLIEQLDFNSNTFNIKKENKTPGIYIYSISSFGNLFTGKLVIE